MNRNDCTPSAHDYIALTTLLRLRINVPERPATTWPRGRELHYYRAVSFSWMNEAGRRSPKRDEESHESQFRKELAQRAAMYYRLRFSKERALTRLRANVSWDFEQSGARPSWLTDDEIVAIVNTTYRRRPSN